MVTSEDRRLDDLERKTGGDDESRIEVNWRMDGLTLDEASGEYVTADEWRKRNPDDRLIILSWGDIGDD